MLYLTSFKIFNNKFNEKTGFKNTIKYKTIIIPFITYIYFSPNIVEPYC